MSNRPRGKFVTFEGGEGAGKTTQVARLAGRLRAEGVEVVTTREPGGAPGADSIRALLVSGPADKWDPLSETLLLYAARREHLNQTIRPSLDSGAWVLCDRFADSTLAYQGRGHGVPEEFIRRLHEITVGDLDPDLTLILDVPVSVGLARAGARNAGARSGEDRFERMGANFHERLRAGFLDIAAAAPERCAVIDADDSPERVAAAVWVRVSAKFGAAPAGAA